MPQCVWHPQLLHGGSPIADLSPGNFADIAGSERHPLQAFVQ